MSDVQSKFMKVLHVIVILVLCSGACGIRHGVFQEAYLRSIHKWPRSMLAQLVVDLVSQDGLTNSGYAILDAAVQSKPGGDVYIDPSGKYVTSDEPIIEPWSLSYGRKPYARPTGARSYRRRHTDGILNSNMFHSEPSSKHRNERESYARRTAVELPGDNTATEAEFVRDVSEEARTSLLALYNATRGPHWRRRNGWADPDVPVCTPWYGVNCTTVDGVLHVTNIQLDDNGLRGSVPDAFGPGLSQLRVLDLSLNALNELPVSFGRDMHQLMWLDLQDNHIWELPEAFSTGFGNLISLQLQNNGLKHLPSGFGQSMNTLSFLSLDDNELRELTEVFSTGFGELAHLQLSNNALSVLPASFGASMVNLTALDLDNNYLSALPESLGTAYGKLLVLGLRSNSLSALPASFGESMGKLNTLLLFNNDLSELPEVFSTGFGELEELDLQVNHLKVLPASFGAGMSKLRLLDLDGNVLSELPDTFSSGLATLTTLHLRSNSLSVLPKSFGQAMQKLRYLYLGDNVVRELPEVFGTYFGGLEDLYLGNNALSILPATFGNVMNKLRELDLGGNGITTLPPAFSAGFAELQTLRLQSNDLNVLPVSFARNMTKLRLLDLEGNGLSELPDVFSTGFGDITYLNLQSNTLTVLPTSFGQTMDKLGFLNLKDNDLRELPDVFSTGFGELTELNLDDNNLSELPHDFGSSLSSVKQLSLRKCGLQRLPSEMFSVHCWGALTDINLAGNQLRSLEGVQFDGLLNASFGLDVSANPLTTLPGELMSLNSLTQLVAFNCSIATLPSPAEWSHQLAVLDVAANFLSGEILWDLLRLPSLVYLRLSGNPLDIDSSRCDAHLSGIVSGVLTVRLSYNELSGSAHAWLQCFKAHTPQLSTLSLRGNAIDGPVVYMPQSLVRLELQDTYVDGLQNFDNDYLALTSVSWADSSGHQMSDTFTSWPSFIPEFLTTLDVSRTATLKCVHFVYRAMPTLLSDRSNLELVRARGMQVEPSCVTELNVLSRALSWNLGGEEQVDGEGRGLVGPLYRSLPNGIGRLEVDLGFFDYEHSRCVKPNYFWDPDEKTCLQCPSHRVCNDTTDHQLHRAAAGYFPINSAGPERDSCSVVKADLVACYRPSACQNHMAPATSEEMCDQHAYTCSEGYDGNSMLCSRCEVGYFEREHKCLKCRDSYRFFVPLLAILAVILVVWLIVDDITEHRESSRHHSALVTGNRIAVGNWYSRLWDYVAESRAVMPLAFFWFQVIGMLGSSGALTSRSNTSGADTVIAIISELSSLEPTTLECIVESSSYNAYVTKTWLVFVAPMVFAGVVGAGYMIGRHCWNRLSMPAWEWMSVWIRLMSLMYFPLAVATLATFNCSSAAGGDVQYLNAAPYVSCDSDAYHGMLAVGIVLFVCMAVAFPVWWFWKQGTHRPAYLGHTMTPLRGELWWWEACVSMPRKVLLAAVLCLFPFHSALIPVGVLVFLLLFAVFDMYWRPFRADVDNALALGFSLSAIVIYIALILDGLSEPSESPMQDLSGVRSFAEFVMWLTVVCILIVLLTRIEYLQKFCVRRDGKHGELSDSNSSYVPLEEHVVGISPSTVVDDQKI